MRHPARILLTGAALLVSVSCYQETTVAPHAAPSIRGNAAFAEVAASPVTVDFVIPAAGGHINVFGLYYLDVPAQAVCDPNAKDSQDGYAAAAWDAPCTVSNSDIPVHVTLSVSHDRLYADFSPSLRFVPGKSVSLSTDLWAPVLQYYGSEEAWPDYRKLGLFFAPEGGAPPVLDAREDLSLRTQIDWISGRVSRRIKHFTGYNVTAGVECTPDPSDPFCVEMDDPPPSNG
jgi:hypothetical protein